MRQDSAASLAARVTLDDIVQRLGVLEDGDEQHRFLDECLNLIDHEELLRRLKVESERHLNDKPLLALRLAETLLWAGERADRPNHRALGLLAKGDALRCLGQFGEAVPLFDEAARIFSGLADDVGWARSRIGWLWPMHKLGRAEEALPVATRALEVLVQHQEWQRAGNLVTFLAWVHSDLAHYDEALALYERAEQYFAHLGGAAEIQIGWLKQHRAWLLNHRGDFRVALRLHQEAREIFVRHGQTVAVLHQDHYIAYSYAGQGHYTAALRLYSDALAAHEALDGNPEAALVAMGLDPEAGWLELDLAECYLALNRFADALTLGQDAAVRFEQCRAPTEVAKARLLGALARAQLGDTETALALLDDAEKAFCEMGFGRQLGIATLLRATLYLREANWRAALATSDRAHALFAERAMPIEQARAELIRARALLALGEYEQASREAGTALAIAAEREVSWLAQEGYHLRGNLARAIGAPEQALGEYDQAIASIEGVQSRLPSELRPNFLEDKLQVYHDAIECCLGLAKPERAFAYLERAKSRALVDYLAGNLDVRTRVRQPANQELVDQLSRLREEHAWLYNRVYGYGLARLPEDEPSEAERSRLAAEIREREKRIARVVERLALDDTADLSALLAPNTGQGSPLPVLDDDTVLIEYYFGNAGGTAFVVSRQGLQVVPLAVGPETIRRRLTRLQLNFEATAQAIAAQQRLGALAANARTLLRELYQDLIEPVASHLVGRARCVVVPFGPTHGVPFNALYDGKRYL
ncbi:MAG TPA: hypothetical protein VIO35_07785, partial [Chloroflexota bacterium]